MTLGKRSDYGDSKFAGLRTTDFVDNIEQAVQEALLCGFDFVVAPLVRPQHRPPAPVPTADAGLPAPFSRDDVLYLGSSQWVRQVVAEVSTWINPDSEEDAALKAESLAAVKAQLAWAAHLGLHAVLLPAPPQPHACAHYAQVINRVLEDVTHMALWLTVPITTCSDSPIEQHSHESGSNGTASAQPQQVQQPAVRTPAFGSAPTDGWELWHTMRSLCSHDQLLGCVLELGRQLPAPEQLARWTAEPLKAVLIPTSCFVLNKRGYPVLPKAHQDFVAHLFTLNVQVIVTGPCLHPPPQSTPAAGTPAAAGGQGLGTAPTATDPTPAEASALLQQQQRFRAVEPGTGMNFTINNPGESHPMHPYWEYLAFLFRKLPVIPEELGAENEYRDYLQAPLQPLQDNLESQTYEVFEKDVIKYLQYEDAVYRALVDIRQGHVLPHLTQQQQAVANGSAAPAPLQQPPDTSAAVSQPSQTPTVVLMVVGAGRGPLVSASMRASARAHVPIRVYAVEKNPNAVVHIQGLLRREGWQERVRIVSADMRHWVAPEPAHVLVSELLGSFGDNELSPECLDGAQRFLAPGGVSIPKSYTSFMAPVSTHKLWTDVRQYKDREHFETPYVCKLHKHHLLSPTQEVFTFTHPNPSVPIDNSRYKRFVFERDAVLGSGILHGFAGFFECELYPGCMLSTHPPTHTPSMASWFPIYFPLREPIYVPAGASIEAHMWRCVGAHKVWYEWAVTGPVPCAIHNVSGRSYYVGL